jgi:hypothetical protein
MHSETCTTNFLFVIKIFPVQTYFVYESCYYRSRNGVVSKINRLQAGRYGVQIPVLTSNLPLLINVNTGSGSHPAFYSMGT